MSSNVVKVKPEPDIRAPFPPELRTLAFVPRWTILPTTVRDNVATHSFYVALYSYMVAETISWKGPRDYLMLDALMHDNDESITSDIPGPIKTAILDEEKTSELLHDMTQQRMEGLIDAYYDLEDSIDQGWISEAHDIRHVADKLDAVLFLILNKRMGNTLVDPALDGGMRSLEAAWRALPAMKDVLDKTWATVVVPTIEKHYTKGARGAHPSIAI